ncbi:MAG: phosphoenolpyruvate synthase, partial [Halanaerobiales bacterium]
RGELRVNLLQCRPLQTHHEDRRVEIPDKIEQEDIFFKSRGNFMGGNFTRKVRKIVYVDPQNYYNLKQREKHDIARMVGELNRHLGKVVEEPFILIGPGRWGSSTPSLGIPVKFADINRAAVLMEVAFNPGNLIPELSFGTHFFQDLVEAEILYVALFPDKEGSIFNRRYLQKLTNMVDLLLTKGEKYKNVLRLYDLGNNELKIYSDIQAGEIIGF